MSMTEDWSHTEVDLIIVDYFSMLADELNGEPSINPFIETV